MFIQMVFDDFSTKEELLRLLPLKTRGIGIYNRVKSFFLEEKVTSEKLVTVTGGTGPLELGIKIVKDSKIEQRSTTEHTGALHPLRV